MRIDRSKRRQILEQRRKLLGRKAIMGGVTIRKPQRPIATVSPPAQVSQLSQNAEEYGKISGIAISTYFGKDTSPQRINILLTSIYSLVASGFNGKIIVVDDCSDTNDHIKKIRDISTKVQCIRRPVNNGLGRCKNTCIKNLMDCEYLFLADDDMIYNGNWWVPYVSASIASGIPHFSHYTPQPDHPPAKIVDIQSTPIRQHFALNGCFLFATKKLLLEIGGFKIMPYKYGFEHTNFTERCLRGQKIPFFCDVVKSEEYIQLNKASLNNKSMKPDVQRANRENYPMLKDPKIFEPIED